MITAPTSTVTAALADIKATKPVTASLRRLGCDLMRAEIEAKDAWSGRNDGYVLPYHVHGARHFYRSPSHNRCRLRLAHALANLRTIIRTIKEQTHV